MTRLGAAERLQFAAAHEHLQAGRLAEALAAAAPLAARFPAEADLHMLAGMAAERLGRAAEAEQHYAAAVRARPSDPDVRNIHANSVAATGDRARALQLFDALLREYPDHRDAHINRALTAEEAGDRDLALRLCDNALERFPGDARLLATRGAIAKNAGKLDQALDDLQQAASLEPGRARTHHNLGVVLNALGEARTACAHFARAAELGLNDVDTAANWAAALLEAGEVNASRDLYRRILMHDPAHRLAARALTRLLREYDARDDAFGHYRSWAEAQPHNQAAWTAWMHALAGFGEFGQLHEVASRALDHHPAMLAAAAAKAFAMGMLGQPAEGARQIEAIRSQAGDEPTLAPRLMQLWIMAGDPERAAEIGEAHVDAYPLDQSAWAYLATAWRLTADEREHWLCDYGRLVRPVDVEPPEGGDPQAYAREVASALDRLHTARRAPGDQSLRTGTQTSGALFDRRDPAIRRFRDAILAAATRSVAELPDDPAHPFLSRKSERLGFSGSWSVRLSETGFHVAHFHAEGWMSPAFYARLPQLSARERERKEGWIMFGRPPDDLGLDLEPRRYVEPVPGRMVLFPSYMWHGTVPFTRGGDRLTAAFDFVPR